MVAKFSLSSQNILIFLICTSKEDWSFLTGNRKNLRPFLEYPTSFLGRATILFDRVYRFGTYSRYLSRILSKYHRTSCCPPIEKIIKVTAGVIFGNSSNKRRRREKLTFHNGGFARRVTKNIPLNLHDMSAHRVCNLAQRP